MLNLIFNAVNNDNLNKALDAGWKGYLSLFIAMGLLFVVVLVLNKISKEKKTK